MTDQDKPPGYYGPRDKNALPGIHVCEKCFEEHSDSSWIMRRAPLWRRTKCWEHLDEGERETVRIEVQLHGHELAGQNFERADLSKLDLREAKLEGAVLIEANLNETKFGGRLKGTNFKWAKLQGATLNGCDLCEAELSFADLSNAEIRKAGLRKADLTEANLEGADLSESHLQGADLTKARLKRAKLDNAKLDGARLADASLIEASLKHASLKSILEGWNLNLRGTDLLDVNLEGSNIWNSDLRGANFTDANLRNCSIRYCSVQAADFTRAVLNGADIREIKYNRYGFRFAAREACRTFHRKTKLLLLYETVRRNLRGHRKRRWREIVSWSLTRPRIRYTRWDSATGADTVRSDDSIIRRYIKDMAFIEEFRARYPRWAFLWRWSCFYGQSFGLWAFWCAGVASYFGLVFWVWHSCGRPLLDLNESANTPFTCWYFSIVTFTTLGFGDVTPRCLLGEVLVTLEVILGYIGLGGLISILANKVARRA